MLCTANIKLTANCIPLQHRDSLRDMLLAGTMGMMSLPAYFWQTTDYCPKFPMRKVDFGEAFFKPIPGIKLTREHPSVLS